MLSYSDDVTVMQPVMILTMNLAYILAGNIRKLAFLFFVFKSCI